MSYSPSKPDPSPSPRLDASQIQTDFSVFGTSFAVNHVQMNNQNQGDHTTVIFTNQTLDPGVDQTLNVLYAINATSHANTQPQLFVQIPKFLPNSQNSFEAQNTPMQLTYNTVNTAGPQYQSFLPGGFILYFGTDTGTTSPNVLIADVITLSPQPSKILMALATPYTSTTIGTPVPFLVSTTINNNHQFTIHSTGNLNGSPISYSIGWVCIAKA